MRKNELVPITIERVLGLCPDSLHIDNSLLIADLNEIPLPKNNRHTKCTFVGLCLEGEGSYSVGTVSHKVRANDVVIVGHGQVLGDITTSKNFRGKAIFISQEYLNYMVRDIREVSDLFVFSREHPVFTLTALETSMFTDYYQMLKQKIETEDHIFRRQIAGTLMATMVYDLCNATKRVMVRPTHWTMKAQDVFATFIRLVEINFRHERRVGWYSDQMNITPKTLLETVKKVSSRTPNEWLDLYTAQEIRIMLRNTTKTIKEIADELNFGTQSSLGKFFKEHVGISPTAYRQTK